MIADDDQTTDADTVDDDSSDELSHDHDTGLDKTGPEAPDTTNANGVEIDLDAMTADLDGVDAALARLAEGTYWTDEVTGEPIPPVVLEANPIGRRN